MYTLCVLTVALASLSPGGEASILPRLDGVSSLALPGSQRGKSYLLDTDMDSTIHDGSGEGGSAGRILIESLAGLGGGVVGMAVGSLALSESPTFGQLAVPLSLDVLATSLGVAVTGWAMDGRGRLGFTLLGSILGLVVPLVAGSALVGLEGCEISETWSCTSGVFAVAGILFLPTVGATLGYELSAPEPWLSHGYASSAPSSPPRFVPVLTLARQGLGATIGIAGRL
ncbi:hypothetical protein DB31_8745 [Hyalangium minutum]|uniref:Uncharacterized protein n=2 Tax=Hyalangium minutum TaxID=394096 RepID=A0A085WHZ2_9BACT|nr:hypothetical protein DB31_8658 [Hyalangium minutum]KFE67392.1 hypothetical protein DB31_8745 [Hyalangium minutum]